MAGNGRLGEFERSIVNRYVERILTLLKSEPSEEVHAAFTRAGLDYDLLCRRAITPPDYDIFVLLHELNRAEFFPGIGLRLGLARDLLDLGVLGYTILSCHNLGAAIQIIAKYHCLTSNAYHLTVAMAGDTLAIQQLIKPKHLQRRVILAEEHVTGLWKVLQYLNPNTFSETALQIRFEHSEPTYVDLYRELLPCDLSFDMPETEIAFPAAWLEQPIQTADKVVEQVCESQCEMLLNELNPVNNLVDDLRRLILAMPANRTPTLDECAGKILVSARTLERRLAESNTSFRRVSNEVRMRLAAEHIAYGYLANKEIAAMLNYSQPGTFYRAFKKWHSVTPGEYRQQLED